MNITLGQGEHVEVSTEGHLISVADSEILIPRPDGWVKVDLSSAVVITLCLPNVERMFAMGDGQITELGRG